MTSRDQDSVTAAAELAARVPLSEASEEMVVALYLAITEAYETGETSIRNLIEKHGVLTGLEVVLELAINTHRAWIRADAALN